MFVYFLKCCMAAGSTTHVLYRGFGTTPPASAGFAAYACEFASVSSCRCHVDISLSTVQFLSSFDCRCCVRILCTKRATKPSIREGIGDSSGMCGVNNGVDKHEADEVLGSLSISIVFCLEIYLVESSLCLTLNNSPLACQHVICWERGQVLRLAFVECNSTYYCPQTFSKNLEDGNHGKRNVLFIHDYKCAKLAQPLALRPNRISGH
jgi:hypothetical protein